jgi:Timeless PAB domain
MRQSVPLVPWNLEQSTLLAFPPFVLLLHKLGFHLPGDVGKVFPRIPHFWTPDVLYATALKLGPIEQSKSTTMIFNTGVLTKICFQRSLSLIRSSCLSSLR